MRGEATPSHFGRFLRRTAENDHDVPDPGSYTLPELKLIDGRKRIRNIYSFGLLDPRLVMTDVRTLLMEPTQARQ